MGVGVQEELDVKLNCAVTNIDRSGATPVVTYKDVATNEEVSITAEEYVVVRRLLLYCNGASSTHKWWLRSGFCRTRPESIPLHRLSVSHTLLLLHTVTTSSFVCYLAA